ncbi:MAG: hypothetical protein L3J07_01700 [Candidatus Magasanikbacteria bacterium]|nr:hypothetical protein [Candidatus Magasanikbacteria bacterium]
MFIIETFGKYSAVTKSLNFERDEKKKSLPSTLAAEIFFLEVIAKIWGF